MMTQRAIFILVCAWILAACGAPGSQPIQEINTATPEIEASATPEEELAVGTPTPDEATDGPDEAASEVDAATPLPQPTLGSLSSAIVGTLDAPGELLPASEIPAELLDSIVADLQTRFSLSRDAIRVSRVEAILWNDGSLGCPQPGQFYTQAIVEGYWFVLQADGISYDYRASKKGYFFLCEQKLPREFGATAMPLQPVLIAPTANP